MLRPKTIGLTIACLALAGIIGFAFATKTTAVLSVQHDRDPVAVRLSDGSLRNAYTVKLLNKSSSPHRYAIFVTGIDARLSIVGNEDLSPTAVAPDASETLRVTLTAADAGYRDVVFTARDETGGAISATDRFLER